MGYELLGVLIFDSACQVRALIVTVQLYTIFYNTDGLKAIPAVRFEVHPEPDRSFLPKPNPTT
jgi:hypothetical protein